MTYISLACYSLMSYHLSDHNHFGAKLLTEREQPQDSSVVQETVEGVEGLRPFVGCLEPVKGKRCQSIECCDQIHDVPITGVPLSKALLHGLVAVRYQRLEHKNKSKCNRVINHKGN